MEHFNYRFIHLAEAMIFQTRPKRQYHTIAHEIGWVSLMGHGRIMTRTPLSTITLYYHHFLKFFSTQPCFYWIFIVKLLIVFRYHLFFSHPFLFFLTNLDFITTVSHWLTRTQYCIIHFHSAFNSSTWWNTVNWPNKVQKRVKKSKSWR